MGFSAYSNLRSPIDNDCPREYPILGLSLIDTVLGE
jgi:hypothetical protein